MRLPVRAFWSLGRHQQAALLAATAYLLAAYARFKIRSVQSLLSTVASPASQSSNKTHRPSPETIVWAIDRVSRRVPWRADCLIQALAAISWLNNHGYRPSLHIGVSKLSSAPLPLEAHAWVSLEGKIILGGEEAGLQFAHILQVPPASS